MFLERVIYPVTTLGPGSRVALWASGCTKHCEGCANPELWVHSDRQQFDVRSVAEILRSMAGEQDAHRLTITGGDPLEQPEDIISLLEAVRPDYDDVLLYTGYRIEELRQILGEGYLSRLRDLVDVLIDGRYVEALNVPEAVLRGSINQRIIFFNERLRPVYKSYLKEGRQVQNFVCEGVVVSVGIHNLPDVRNGRDDGHLVGVGLGEVSSPTQEEGALHG